MKTKPISFRMEEGLKKDMEQTFEEMGITVSGAFTLFAKAVVRTGSIPFDIVVDPFYRKENIDELSKRIEGYETGNTQMVDMTEEFEEN